MFRDKPTAYERLSDAIGDIGDRIGDLESQIAERVNPKPSAFERLGRSVEHQIARLPGLTHHSTASRYLPSFATGWSVPSASDARASLDRAQRSLRETASDARDHLPKLSNFHWPELRAPRAKSFKRGMDTQRGIDYLRERPELTTALVAGGAILALGAAFYVTKKIADHAEEPDYETVRSGGEVEIRDYDAMLIAETVKSGYHEKARSRGFETLYDYIRANNRSGKKIAMTVPVLQQLSEAEGRKGWAIRFVMPKKYTKASLPTPNGGDVKIEEVPARRMAAIRFSGTFSASLASRKLMALYNYLSDEGLKQKGDPIYAFYNPPWTPGFMRRNEILIEIEG
ncbi:SOUL family heme-binding protein [Aureimonas mangrovi]|uniref:SOUL family heme-binding protein n=1 Tax=Aureimonas mangrovi TaxID=2758041 RepID=UPI00163DD002|nr:heme-binding protein [Aureimonas mangrovi]